MFITLKTVKKELGLFGLEYEDFIIAIPVAIIFLIIFIATPFKLISLAIPVIAGFLLLPISISNKNRIYKLLILIYRYSKKEKQYFYSKNENNYMKGNYEKNKRSKRKKKPNEI